jgi:hypothetical protein
MLDFVTVEVDGVQYQVLPRQAEIIANLRNTISVLAQGIITEASVTGVRVNGDWGSHFSVMDDHGYDRLAAASERTATELRKRSLLFQGSAPITNRSTARN